MSPFALFQSVQHDIIFVSKLTSQHILESIVNLIWRKAIESYLPQAFCSNLLYGKVNILPDDDFLGKGILPIITVEMEYPYPLVIAIFLSAPFDPRFSLEIFSRLHIPEDVVCFPVPIDAVKMFPFRLFYE